MTFSDPQMLWLLVGIIPLLWWAGRKGMGESMLFSSTLLIGDARHHRDRTGTLSRVLLILGILLLIPALARPQKETGEQKIQASGVEIVVAMDLSTSMLAEDFETNGVPANRITVARNVVSEFIDHRPSDRIGLVAFAAEAFIASPITLDHPFVKANLSRLEAGSIPDGTAVGSALIASVDRLRNRDATSRIIILMTDGQSNRGEVPPETAAEVARTMGIKVYTIGVGTEGEARTPVRDYFGRTSYRMTKVDIDEDSLRKIADKTGARYYRADSTETLNRIYNEIDQLEKTDFESHALVLHEELFHWFAIPGLLFLLLHLVLSHTILRQLP